VPPATPANQPISLVLPTSRNPSREIDHARQYATRKGWTADDAEVFVDDGM